MTLTLIQMSLLMLCGVGWRVLRPAGLSAEQTRPVLTSVVYYLLFPALVLRELWTVDVGWQSLSYTAMGVCSISFALVCMWLFAKLIKPEKKRLGAMLLAASFPNVTYLGLPVLEQTFGHWARAVVIQLDLFAVAPFLFSVGVMISRHYGEDPAEKPQSTLRMLSTPPIWAAIIAVTLNLNGISAPFWLSSTLEKMAAAVVPLMIIAIGLALNWRAINLRNLPHLLPVLALKMLIMPLFVMSVVGYTPLDPAHQAAAVMDLAMPSMVVGVIFCDRYRLDSSFYAMCVTVSTGLSLFALPFWYKLLAV